LSCMMYVDLNPIRAGLATTPESSEYTSIYERIQVMSASVYGARKRGRPRKEAQKNRLATGKIDSKAESKGQEKNTEPMAPLCAFSDQVDAGDQDKSIPFIYRDYLALLDWTGRAVRLDKRGSIPEHLQPILMRLGIESSELWVRQILGFKRRYACYVGRGDHLQQISQQLGQRWVKGQAA